MNIIEYQSKVLFQQHEGNRQFASVLSSSTRALFLRLMMLLAKMPRRFPGAYPF